MLLPTQGARRAVRRAVRADLVRASAAVLTFVRDPTAAGSVCLGWAVVGVSGRLH